LFIKPIVESSSDSAEGILFCIFAYCFGVPAVNFFLFRRLEYFKSYKYLCAWDLAISFLHWLKPNGRISPIIITIIINIFNMA